MRESNDLPKRSDWFDSFARKTSLFCGKPVVFLGAVLIVLIWAVTGPMFGFSDTWQLVINTGTTIVTFLMVFLIQNTQNRDGVAVQVKLDEIIRCTSGAHNALLDLEELEEDELHQICREYEEIAHRAREALRKGKSDTGVAKVKGRRPSR